jgi:hypothetical protein
MTATINGRQLYNISINHYRGAVLWAFQAWHTSVENAISYGNEMAAYHYADEPVGALRVSAQLA